MKRDIIWDNLMHGCEFDEPPMKAQILPDGFHCHMYHWRMQPANIPENLDFECVSVSETREIQSTKQRSWSCDRQMFAWNWERRCFKMVPQAVPGWAGQDMVNKIVTVNND